jgi:hypothetical protein
MVNLDEIFNGHDAIEGERDAVVLNPIALGRQINYKQT